ncbi:curli assembly protein CsgF [Pusillimonas noertemannii]|uniref:Curli production assembly/transport component CsgF n=1 Tax=Pusillimonas noertemannii TaxID=305977 RepID=A0A2U1CHQ3_9BURK|nr:curli assembly protein CsgF [Pusillimonas noertemannii]NYT70308.1 curli assembly protein CsgF [Pusillimonas noertemannii]PVY60450.1 curli production assembly/transport component CsgF [Pusillimonas noertemannii]TFL08054.1 curli assembly protein CsgF [Pusillimonas noertemannii]
MKTKHRLHGAAYCASAALAALLASSPATATEMVYYPLNPSFGGSPLNGPVLLNSALATNKHTDPAADQDLYGSNQQSPLEIFQDTLERAILGRLAASATSRIVGEDGKLIPGNLETENFTINIVDVGGGLLSITTVDKVTGGSTTFQVGQ